MGSTTGAMADPAVEHGCATASIARFSFRDPAPRHDRGTLAPPAASPPRALATPLKWGRTQNLSGRALDPHRQAAAYPQREHGLRDDLVSRHGDQPQLAGQQREHEGGFQHAEVVPYAEPRPGAERNVGVTRSASDP